MNELMIKVSKKSASYLLVTKFGGIDSWEIEEGYVDSCQYTRAIIKGCIGFAFFGILSLMLGGGILFLFGRTLAWLISALVVGLWGGYDGVVFVALGLLLVLSVTGLSVLLSGTFRKLSIHPSEIQLYQAWKEKHCHKVEAIE